MLKFSFPKSFTDILGIGYLSTWFNIETIIVRALQHLKQVGLVTCVITFQQSTLCKFIKYLYLVQLLRSLLLLSWLTFDLILNLISRNSGCLLIKGGLTKVPMPATIWPQLHHLVKKNVYCYNVSTSQYLNNQLRFRVMIGIRLQKKWNKTSIMNRRIFSMFCTSNMQFQKQTCKVYNQKSGMASDA